MPGNSPVVLELFTSEGCSSCPAADRLLPDLAALNSSVIALSFHVDYWDKLGWKDPFSDARFTERQSQYAKRLNLESIYTPQLVINGEHELVGSDRSKAEKFIRGALNDKTEMQIDIEDVKKENNSLHIRCKTKGDWKNLSILTAVLQNHAETNVGAGENGGARLTHTNVVRSFSQQPAHEIMDYTIPFPSSLDENNWSLAIYAQHIGNLKISGAAIYHPVK